MSASHVDPDRVRRYYLTAYSPIRGINPMVLTRKIDAFNAGYLREFALLAEAIARRDDLLKTVIPKRSAAVARRGYEIVTTEKSAEADDHKAALEYFYKNLRTTDVLDEHKRGGTRMLIAQMMSAIGMRYAAHEISWRPRPEGLTADFRFVPLWFFEHRTERLRFLPSDFATEGVPLEDDQWMVCVGDGLMEASSIGYLIKSLSLRDWVMYSEKHGMPGIQGKTAASKGSDQWQAMMDAVNAISADFSCVTGMDDKIEKIDFSAAGELPYPKLVERMDRVLTALWRGADLSTMSSTTGAGQGASVQGGESANLEQDDAAWVSENLNEQIDRRVIETLFGPGTEPLARFEIQAPPKDDQAGDIAVDEFLQNAGAPLGLAATLERYGRPMPADDEVLLKPLSLTPPDPSLDDPNAVDAGDGDLPNEGKGSAEPLDLFMAAARMEVSGEWQKNYDEIADRLVALANAETDLPAAFARLKSELPALTRNNPGSLAAWERVLGPMVASGLTETGVAA